MVKNAGTDVQCGKHHIIGVGQLVRTDIRQKKCVPRLQVSYHKLVQKMTKGH